MPTREYSGNAKRTALKVDIAATTTTFDVVDATGYPTGATGPFAIALALGNAAEEKVLVASRSGNTFTVATGGRGYDGTTAAAHRAGVNVDHVLTATDVRESNAHVNDTTGDPHPQYLTPTEASSAYRALAFRGAAVFTSGTAQSVPNSTYTAIEFASETADTSGFHDNATNNSRLTIPVGMGGWYAISAQVGWTANATGTRVLSIRKNGSAYLSDSGATVPAGADPTKTTVMYRALLAAGDYVEIMGRQSSGGALTVSPLTNNHADIEFLGA